MRFNSCDLSQKFRKIFVFVLSLIIMISVLMFSGCAGGDVDDIEDNTPTPTATATATPKPALIKNGNFEETYDTSYPKTPKFWSSYGDSFGGKTAPLTDATYGIVNTETEIYDENKSAKYGDIDNPGVSSGSGDDDKNIIMLYNKQPTATKYKSQSITLPANSYAIVSLFVKTAGIKPFDEDNEASYDYYGATIALSGMEEPVYINGINTYNNLTEINDWKEYKFYLEGSATSSKTFYIELGLGTGSPDQSKGYTSGHAFFDAVKMDYINKASFETALFGDGVTAPLVEKNGNQPIYTSDSDSFFYYDNNKYKTNPYYVNRIDTKGTNLSAFAYSYKNRANILTQNLDLSFLDPAEVVGSYFQDIDNDFDIDKGDIDVDGTEFTEELKDYPFSSSKVFMINNKNYATQGFKTDDITIKSYTIPNGADIQPAYSYYKISVYLKTSNFLNNGLNVALVKTEADPDIKPTYTWFNNINTGAKNLTAEDLEEDANISNKWSNWTEYSFYFEANPFNNVEISLEFWLGPKTVSNLQLNKFTKGYALFSEISLQKLTSAEYSSASAGDTVKTGIKLYETGTPGIANGGFNASSDANIINKPVNPNNWTGYFGGYGKMLGDNSSTLVANHKLTSVYSGIINQNYLGAYENNNYIDTNILTNFETVGAPNYLMINNADMTSYGYVSQSKTLSASSYYKFSVMVKTFGTAKASIYLTDADGKVIELKNATTNISTFTEYKGESSLNWTEYEFYIKTGELSKTAKIELWNGTRDGLADTTSQGYVLFDDVVFNSTGITKAVFDEITAGDTVLKFDFEGVDIAPTATPTPTPEPTETPVPQETPRNFQWDLLTTLLLAVVLLFVLFIIIIRKVKKSKMFKPKKVKIVRPSYSRDKLKFLKSKTKPVKEKEEDLEEDEEYEDEDDEEVILLSDNNDVLQQDGNEEVESEDEDDK